MNNPALIASLCADLTPVRQYNVEKQVALGALIGGGISLVAISSMLGVQPRLMTSASLAAFGIKFAFALSLAAVGFNAVRALARPNGRPTNMFPKLAAIFVLLASIALVQSGYVNNASDGKLWLGASWQSCSLRIAAFSIPITAMIGWAVRRQAPVRLRSAGAAVGLTSGATAAGLYALACGETSSTFILIWYSLGIALSTALGAIAGPRLLRW